MEDCRVLKRLIKALPKAIGYRPYMVGGRDSATGQNVGILTRIDPTRDLFRSEERAAYPVAGSKCKAVKKAGSEASKGATGVSKHYMARLAPYNSEGRRVPIFLVGLHLIAWPLDKGRCVVREGQAEALRTAIRAAIKPGEQLIILGDFNDYDEDVIGTDGRTPISGVVGMLRETAAKPRGPLVNAAWLLPQKERYSCWYDANKDCHLGGDRERVFIDHILVDPRLKIESAHMRHDLYGASCDSQYSDHWPFVVTIDLDRA